MLDPTFAAGDHPMDALKIDSDWAQQWLAGKESYRRIYPAQMIGPIHNLLTLDRSPDPDVSWNTTTIKEI
jgi:hypothetical protein